MKPNYRFQTPLNGKRVFPGPSNSIEPFQAPSDPISRIHLGAIQHNLQVVRSLLSRPTGVIAVIKADAYGHGAPQVASALAEMGVKFFGVATVNEGVELRRRRINGRIVVLIPPPPLEFEKAIQHDLTLSVSGLKAARILSQVAFHLGRKAKAHLMVDTGLTRDGFHCDELLRDLPGIRRLKGLQIEGIWSHFATLRSLSGARAVLDSFREVVARAKRFFALPFVHMANSMGTVLLKESHFNLVRPGLALYGYLPNGNRELPLAPAMKLTAPITSVKRYPAGTAVSYEGTYVLERPANLATVRCGYADGYDFHLSNSAEVAIGGKRYPLAGRVTMDQMVVNLGDDWIRPESRAVLLGGGGPSALELARKSGSIPYSVLARSSIRVKRVWTHSKPEGKNQTADSRLFASSMSAETESKNQTCK